MRKEYEMTQAQLDAILNACKPVPYMVFGGMEPRSPQENANDAWAALGKEMGFDHMTVRPNGKGDRFFSADALSEGDPL
jgi:hypothetical protein